MTKPILDISKWQGNINFDTMAANAAGVIMRASHGEWPDSKFRQNYHGLHQRVAVGAYHYWKPDLSQADQVRMFAAEIDGMSFGLGLWVDVEDTPAVNAPAKLADRLQEFIHRLKQARPFDEIGIYTRASYWDYFMQNAAPWAANFRLWVAHYTSGDTPIVPATWKGQWYLWQYSADGNGRGAEFGAESKSIDINRLNPEFIEPDDPDDPPKPEPQILPRLRVLRRVNVREAPRLTASRVAQLHAGDVVNIRRLHIANAWQVWVLHNGGWSAVTYNGVKFMEGVA